MFKHWTFLVFAPSKLLRQKYETFKELLRHDQKSLELITDLEELLYGKVQTDWARVDQLVRGLRWSVGCLIRSLISMHPAAYRDLEERFQQIEISLQEAVSLPEVDVRPPYTMTLAEAAQNPRLAGGKAYSLARGLTEAGLPGPRGFVVTTNAFNYFLNYNQIRHRLDELLAQVRLDDWKRLVELSGEMVAIIKHAVIPSPMQEEIVQRIEEYRQQGVAGPWVARSSAAGEDGEVSWAGQYASILNVSFEEILEAYKEILASKYSPQAVTYRIRCGLADQETPMAVLLMEMIDASVSGVVYTREPTPEEAENFCVAVYAATGLGGRLVDGSAVPEVHYLTREEPPHLLETIVRPAVGRDQKGPPKPCLSNENTLVLARWGMILEKLFGGPQDIEWCQDKNGVIFLLQSRPLKTGPISACQAWENGKIPEFNNPILLEGGLTASPGMGTGSVCVVRMKDELRNVPEAAVLVSPSLPPSFATILERLRAVVADGGSRASHFACVAREFGVPVIVGTQEATKILKPDQVVTVDANRRRVYQGEVESLQGCTAEPPTRPDTPFSTRLRSVMEYITPLSLIDPTSPDFAPRACRSMHDFTRFAHEKGMAEMFSLVGRSGRGLARARRLQSDLPLVMYVLDLEGGISSEGGEGKTVEPRFITSEPMRACWEGLTHPDVVWQEGLLHIDWEEFDRISASLVKLRSAVLASYAVISRYYLHLILRFGYHFAVTDALCSNDAEANYIAFRFKGGGGNFENRILRVQFIKIILEWAGFTVNTRGDLLDARFDRQEPRTILSRLTLLGLLQGKTRLLDIALTGKDQVFSLADSFMGRYQEYVEGQKPPSEARTSGL
ncbi:MAG: pyruvate kinase [Deltaproteobacteria bacterium]|nr:pyruvate kinase [Deltaproteobacteria bacterium]